MENNIQENVNLEMVNNENVLTVSKEIVGATSIVEPVAQEKKYNFRRLRATDIGLITAVVKRIGVSKVAACFKNEEVMKAMTDKNNVSMESVGIVVFAEVLQIVLEGYSDCEKELHKLLAETSDLTLEEVQTLELSVFFEMLQDFFRKEELMGFLKQVLKLLGMEI